ncbi:hypothetical protein DFJ74DRAFT_701965 [Hyaloraphidium curvatum]|nr:hypothetical protein DFJ74DRAFT_701965 [Hyaloraphidium curvatum]
MADLDLPHHRGSCESRWDSHELMNSVSALWIIVCGFFTFLSDHRAHSMRLAGALLLLNGVFSFSCHYGVSWSTTLEYAACTLDGSTMLVPAALMAVTLGEIVLDQWLRGLGGPIAPHGLRLALYRLARGTMATVVAFILCLGIIGQHNRFPGSPIYYYATLGGMSLIGLVFALLAIFPLGLLDSHPHCGYVKHWMVPLGIASSLLSTVFMGAVEGTCDRNEAVLSKIPAHALFHVFFPAASYMLMQFCALLVSILNRPLGHSHGTVVHLIPSMEQESFPYKLKRWAFDLLFLLKDDDGVHSGQVLLGDDDEVASLVECQIHFGHSE